jgi:hypothetical protein
MLRKPRYVLTESPQGAPVHTDKGQRFIIEEWDNIPFYRGAGEDSFTLSTSGEQDAEPERLEWLNHANDLFKWLDACLDVASLEVISELELLHDKCMCCGVPFKTSRKKSVAHPKRVCYRCGRANPSKSVTGAA